MIEQLVLDLVTSIAAGQLPELTSVSTSTKNVILAHPEAEQAGLCYTVPEVSVVVYRLHQVDCTGTANQISE